MPIEGIVQPEILPVSPALRLRKYDGKHDFALPWYQDRELVRLVDGPDAAPYDGEKLARMYSYLDGHGELYWIEGKSGPGFTPIGDVTLCREDLPIVIGPGACRGKGVGKAVVSALIRRARSLCWDHMAVREIYSYNTASQRLFLSCGFREAEKTELGSGYRLELQALSEQPYGEHGEHQGGGISQQGAGHSIPELFVAAGPEIHGDGVEGGLSGG